MVALGKQSGAASVVDTLTTPSHTAAFPTPESNTFKLSAYHVVTVMPSFVMLLSKIPRRCARAQCCSPAMRSLAIDVTTLSILSSFDFVICHRFHLFTLRVCR